MTIARSDKYDVQGWAGVCDIVHVELIQGSCEPLGDQINLVVYLSEASTA
ncbi:MAG: hypothetical protein ACI8S3_000724, partial [Alphaproteobacteria bacterium]